MLLTEKYAREIKVSENLHKQLNDGEGLSLTKRNALAICLENLNGYMNFRKTGVVNEAVSSVDQTTQRSAIGNIAKFCVNVTAVALPNLIAFDLVKVHAMDKITGSIAFPEYLYNVTKGAITAGDSYNSFKKLGKVDPNYTSAAVVEPIAEEASQYVAVWLPVVKGIFKDAEGNAKDLKVVHADGTATFADFGADGKTATVDLVAGDRVAYKYVNDEVPQEKIPGIKAQMHSIPLFAEPRRIAISWDLMAEFQAKKDHTIDLSAELANQAIGLLNYEIDTKICEFLDEMAGPADETLVWSKTLPVGVSKMDHYAGFAEIVALANAVVFKRTKKFRINKMVASIKLESVLTMMPGFKAADIKETAGPYLLGTLGSVKVYIHPEIADGRFVCLANYDELQATPAVYGIYMPIVDTETIQFKDGLSEKGYCTMDCMERVNEDLLVAGLVTD